MSATARSTYACGCCGLALITSRVVRSAWSHLAVEKGPTLNLGGVLGVLRRELI